MSAVVQWERRYPPSRPLRLGTRRRRPPQAGAASEPGASWPRKRPASLDTEKNLEISKIEFPKTSGKNPAKRPPEPMNCRQWLMEGVTARETWRETIEFHRQVLDSVHEIMEKWMRKARSLSAETQHDLYGVLESAGDAERALWLDRYAAVQVRLEGESGADAYKRVKEWLKNNRPTGAVAEWLKWERTYFAISNCGKEYIGWKAACCEDRTRAIAVPVGCGHRLCPRCAYRRSQRGRAQIKTMLDRLTHPALVTFTKPNLPTIAKGDINFFRKQVRAWFAGYETKQIACGCGHGRDAHKEKNPEGGRRRTLLGCSECACQQWQPVSKETAIQHQFLGGIYSIENTYNRKLRNWHLHAHALVDMNLALPSKFIEEGGKRRLNRVEFFGKRVLAFTALKWRMEFDWLLLTGGREKWGSRPKNDPPKKSPRAKEKWLRAWENYWFNFGEWVRAKREHSTLEFKVKSGSKWYVRSDLTAAQAAEYKRREAWNAENTRVFHIQPVTDREGAAYEVLKYITKVADFSDRPEAMEEFCNASCGAHLVQTFGTWYGFAFDVQFNPDHPDDWGKRPDCACGMNHWEKTGVYDSRDVEMDDEGRFLLREGVLLHDYGGTTVRPRTSGVNPQREETDYGSN